MITQPTLTQPRVIKFLSSVNCITNSSSSIVQVSLVECCLGINSVVTIYLSLLGFPSSNPQVSLLFSVLTLAIDKNLGRHSFGNLTDFSSRGPGSLVSPLVIRGVLGRVGGGTGCFGGIGGGGGRAPDGDGPRWPTCAGV